MLLAGARCVDKVHLHSTAAWDIIGFFFFILPRLKLAAAQLLTLEATQIVQSVESVPEDIVSQHEGREKGQRECNVIMA